MRAPRRNYRALRTLRHFVTFAIKCPPPSRSGNFTPSVLPPALLSPVFFDMEIDPRAKLDTTEGTERTPTKPGKAVIDLR